MGSALFKPGDAVKQVQPAPVTGNVAGFAFDPHSGEIQYLVSWRTSDGVVHSRHFKADEIEAIEPAKEGGTVEAEVGAA